MKRLLLVVLCVLSLSACVPTAPTTSQPQSYEPFDWPRFNSGLYADYFAGRSVVIDGTYSVDLIYKNIPLQGLIVFDVIAPQGPQSGAIAVNAPTSMRDTVFLLREGQKVRVYGTFKMFSMYSRIDRQLTGVNSLQFHATRIEPL
jgi:hypothetical protein